MFGKNFYKLKYSSKPFFFLSRYSFTFKNNRIFTICFIGRPNVGKSTLMNALSGERISLVDNIPGLTRDRKEGIIKLFDVKLKLVDTAGVDNLDEKLHTDVLLNESVNQTRKALVQSDLAFFIVDARAGITEEDISLSNWINERKSYNSKMKELEENLENISKEQNINNEEKEKLYENYKKMKLSKDVTIPPIKLIINKAENNFRGNEIDIDYYKLNLGEPIYISAEHGDNMV
jgi:GTP-binding protein